MTKQEKIYAQAQSGTVFLSQAGQAQNAQAPIEGQISLEDILANANGRTFGNPSEESEVN